MPISEDRNTYTAFLVARIWQKDAAPFVVPMVYGVSVRRHPVHAEGRCEMLFRQGATREKDNSGSSTSRGRDSNRLHNTAGYFDRSNSTW